MIIERDNEDIVIRINPDLIGMDVLQKTIDYLRALELNAQTQGTQEQADAPARESQQGWWKENRHRFIK